MLEITQEIIDSFRERYKQFNCNIKWDDTTLADALCQADTETGSKRWGVYQDKCNNFKQRGMFLFTAHYLTTFYRNDDSTVSPGAKHNVSSKSVGDESISYMTNKGLSDLSAGDEWLSTTQYGQMFMRLRRRAGMGALAV